MARDTGTGLRSTLRIAPTLTLPVAIAGESTAILAKKGAGKSNTAKVIVEETLDHGGVQVIVLDPIGHWWSLRAGADGKPKGGYPVVVFGGMHGDLPLEETAGKLLAQTAVESGQSMVLDVSGLDSNGAMQRFVYELLEELYKLKQATPTPVLLVLEEADEFAPQDPKGANVPRMVGAANRISKRGRGRGIGMLYVTQRSAALNKNVLDQADTLIVMRTIGPRDRAAIEGWVKHQDAAGMDQVLPSLPSLATGEAWVWTPERNLLERVQIRKARTFDSSWTPKPGETAIVADVKPIDVAALGEAIKATVERAKENDPAELRRRIRDLEARAKDVPASEVTVERVEVPVFNGEVDRLEAAMLKLGEFSEGLVEVAVAIGEAASSVAASVAAAKSAPADSPRTGTTSQREPKPTRDRPAGTSSRSRPAPAAAPDPGASGGGSNLTGPEQRVLDAIRWYSALGIDTPTKLMVGFIAGYRVGKRIGGTYGNILGRLRSSGLIDYPGAAIVTLTDEGLAYANDPGIEATNEALQDAVLDKLDGPEGRVLSHLIDVYPLSLPKQELGHRSGYTVGDRIGGTFGNILGRLRSLGLIDYPAPGEAVALAVLFPEDS